MRPQAQGLARLPRPIDLPPQGGQRLELLCRPASIAPASVDTLRQLGEK